MRRVELPSLGEMLFVLLYLGCFAVGLALIAALAWNVFRILT